VTQLAANYILIVAFSKEKGPRSAPEMPEAVLLTETVITKLNQEISVSLIRAISVANDP